MLTQLRLSTAKIIGLCLTFAVLYHWVVREFLLGVRFRVYLLQRVNVNAPYLIEMSPKLLNLFNCNQSIGWAIFPKPEPDA